MKNQVKNRNYCQYLVAIAIALSLQLAVRGQKQPETAVDNIRERLSSPWENAVLSQSLASATAVNAIEFSPDGTILASVGASQITLWDVASGEIQRVLSGHYASDINLEIAPTAIAFSPDSQYLASSTWSQGLLNPERAIKVRDLATGADILSLTDIPGCRQILFAPTGDRIYGACETGITVWSFPTGEKLFSFDTAYPVEAIAISPDGKVMATVDANIAGGQQGELVNQIQLWQLNSSEPKLIETLDGHSNEIVQLKFTQDGNKLVSSSYDGKINVWHWQQGKVDRRTHNLQSDSGVFSLNRNSQLIAGNFHSSTMTDLTTGLPLSNTRRLRANQAVQIMAFNPQNQVFATVTNQIDSNSRIDLWSVDNSLAPSSPNIKDSYRAIPIRKYWTLQPAGIIQPEVSSQPKPSSLGNDPQAISLSALGLTEIVEAEREAVQTEYIKDNLARVTITQTNLPDDSVTAIRYLLEFAPHGAAAEQKWQLVWVGEQFKCHQGRGQQDWSSNLCL
ncbi:MAG: hypothetical protein AAFQ41_14685 [Cyanobacteria bacterium J06623_7]